MGATKTTGTCYHSCEPLLARWIAGLMTKHGDMAMALDTTPTPTTDDQHTEDNGWQENREDDNDNDPPPPPTTDDNQEKVDDSDDSDFGEGTGIDKRQEETTTMTNDRIGRPRQPEQCRQDDDGHPAPAPSPASDGSWEVAANDEGDGRERTTGTTTTPKSQPPPLLARKHEVGWFLM
jgi:hypothetical protein